MFVCFKCNKKTDTIATVRRGGRKYDLCANCFKSEIEEVTNEAKENQE